MRAPLSIVIPTLDAADDLPGTLAALAEGLEAGLIRELVVSDGGSADATRAAAYAAGAIFAQGPAGRGGQLARGARQAGGDWLLFLHPDTQLGAGWSRAILDHMRDRPNRAGHFRLAVRARGTAPRLVSGWANLRARAFGLPCGDQGLLISRRLYDAVGGYRDIPVMEDVAIARALAGRLSPIPAIAATGAGRHAQGGWVRREGRNMLALARYLMGADPERLARASTK